MSELVANCPRCKASNITFDVKSENFIGIRYSWQHHYEVFSVCRNCSKSTTFIVSQKEIHDKELINKGITKLPDAINKYLTVEDYISLKNISQEKPPEHVPTEIEEVFKEGAACMSINCFNAAGTMFRLCLDMATENKLPSENENGLNNKIRRSLGLRLEWLFDKNILPESLKELASCIKDDGNDGAHKGILIKEEAEDLLDFTFIMLERLYTEPKRIEIATERRQKRHEQVT